MIMYTFYWLVALILLLVKGTAQNFIPLPVQNKTSNYVVYYSKDCSETQKLARFPASYELENESFRRLNAASEFNATYFEMMALDSGGKRDDYYPGILVQFRVPDVSSYGGGGNSAISARGHDAKPRSRDQSSKYDVTVQTSDVIEVATGQWKQYINSSLEPEASATWSPKIRYEVHGDAAAKSVEVVFTRPNAAYHFRRFEVALISKKSVIDVHVVSTSSFHHTFVHVTPGEYKLMFRPIDEYFSIVGRCLCRLDNGACSSCLTTRIESIQVT